MQTGRIPNRSGMTTVAFQGQGGGLPAAEWTLASILKTADYRPLRRQMAPRRSRLRAPTAQGYDEMEYFGLYHLNAYTYGDPKWFPGMDPELRDMFQRVTKGAISGTAGVAQCEDFKINGEYVKTPDQSISSEFRSLMNMSRRPRSIISTAAHVGQAVLHERQLHEGPSAQHAGAEFIHKSPSQSTLGCWSR